MSTKLPRFETEEQVREFWASHDLTEYFDELEELPEGVTMLLPRPTSLCTSTKLSWNG